MNTECAPLPLLDAPVSADTFRQTLGSLAATVGVVTTTVDSTPFGCTATAIMSLTDSPPTLLVSLALTSQTAGMIQRAGSFAVSFLADEPAARDLATLFARSGGDKFTSIDYTVDPLGNAILSPTVATASCQVTEHVVLEDHMIFVGLVTSATVSATRPLLYFRRDFTGLG